MQEKNQSPKFFGDLLGESRVRSWVSPHRVALVLLWLTATIAFSAMLWQGVRDTGRFGTARCLLLAAYTVGLLWYLSWSGPSTSQLPEIHPVAFPRWRFGVWIPALGIALLFALVGISDAGTNLLIFLTLPAAAGVLIAWRREIRLLPVLQGVVITAVAFVVGAPMVKNHYISETAGYGFTLVLLLPTYLAGGLLVARTRLGGVQLLARRYLHALGSFLGGCLLFVPHGLANAAGGSPTGLDFAWVNQWWMPASLPWWSGLVEETWFRLFLVGLVYLLLRPTCQKRPSIAVLAAVLFSGITFGLGHGRTLDHFLNIGLLYGVPFALLFARRDWEHAVGAHYMTNMISWVMVFFAI